MPTFSVIALDRILEPTTRNNNNSNNNNETGCVSGRPNLQGQKENNSLGRRRNLISPALYATPPRTPVPDYPASFNPSPYVVDHKKRAPCVGKNVKTFEPWTNEGQNERKRENEVNIEGGGPFVDSDGPEFVENARENENLILAEDLGSVENMANGGPEFSDLVAKGLCQGSSCDDDFLEVEDWKSVASSSDVESRSRRSFNFSTQTGQSEYFDAMEDVYPEDASQTSESYNTMLQGELDRLKYNISVETERRMMAEETLTHMKNQWQEMAKKFSLAGLSFPSIRMDSACQAVEEDPVDEIRTQLLVARLVSGAIGRVSARAELEQDMEAIIECKNREIARLRDKLQYFEVVNHEMSQRNQEAIEIARRRRRTEKKRHRWLWGSLAVAVTIGTTALWYSYLPRSEKRVFSFPWTTYTDNHGTTSDNVEI